jgi:hypothetical protein
MRNCLSHLVVFRQEAIHDACFPTVAMSDLGGLMNYYYREAA